MIKAILFDFDGVLTVDKYGSVSMAKFLSEKTGLPHDQIRAVYGKYNAKMLYGETTHEEIWSDFCAELGIDADFSLIDEAFRATPMNPEMLDLVRELKKNYKIGMVTDNPAERMDAAVDHFGLRPLFDAITVSGTVRVRKDRPEIFEAAFAALNVRPEECVFIDNTPKNLIVPGQMGVKTILFDDETNDVPSLRKSLEDILSAPKIISFQVRLEAFDFLGMEHELREDSDFGAFWNSFFAKGGYGPIDPFSADPSCVNIWYCEGGKARYFQGKRVRAGAEVHPGYTLKRFPACEYLVVTTEWLPGYEASMQHINHDYYRNIPIPNGFRRHPEEEDGMFLLERWGAETEHGYRYEFWLPIERID